MEDMQQVQVILFGGSNSCKTKLRKFFCNQKYSHNGLPVIGLYVSLKVMQYQQRKVRLIIVEASQQHHFVSIAQQSVKECQYILYVYEVSRPQTLTQAMNYFIQTMKAGQTGKKTMLVEYVLDQNKRALPQGKGEKIARANGMIFQQILDSQPSMLDQMFKRIIKESSFSKGKDKLSLYINERMDKAKCWNEIQSLYEYIEKLLQRVTQLEQSVKKQKVLLSEIDRLKEKIKRIQYVHKETVEQLKSCKDFISNLQAYKDAYEVVSLYEKENLKFRQMFKEFQQQYKQSESKLKNKCQQMQQICDQLGTISIKSLTAKLNKISFLYSKYRLMHCSEETIDVVERDSDQTSIVMSNILQGMNTSFLSFE